MAPKCGDAVLTDSQKRRVRAAKLRYNMRQRACVGEDTVGRQLEYLDHMLRLGPVGVSWL